MEHRSTLTVTELNEYIKLLLDSQPLLSKLFVVGEISNFTDHRSGHLYFTLKDKDSAVRAVMFRSYASKLAFRPENGMKVIVRGSVSAFPRDGQYQVYVEDMQPDGAGTLFTAFEQLKKQLEAKGLFDRSLKKKLPEFPERVGIITSPTGAAIRDMLNISARRCPMAEIVIYPSLVQGDSAEANLIKAIDYFEESHLVDVIIIGRGGGSIEDLWAFNGEALARRIFAAKTPIVSAVGHETDFTICDFVADMRAPTPSAAAELVTGDVRELVIRIDSAAERASSALVRLAERKRERLDNLMDKEIFKNASILTEPYRESVNQLYESIKTLVTDVIQDSEKKLSLNSEKLHALSPLAVLSRGYAVAMSNKKRISGIDQIAIGADLNIQLADGSLSAIVTEKTKRGNEK